MLVLLAALASFYRSGSYDFWFHLGAGRAIAEHGFPSSESWSMSAARQAPFLAGWPYQLALHEIARFAGDLGLALWRAGWVALAAALAIATLRLLGAASWPAWTLGLLVVAAARDAMRVRPEQMLAALFLYAVFELERARRGPADRTRLLVPAQVLWANAHLAWILGPLVTWIYSIREWWAESGAPAPPAGAAPKPNRSRRWMILGLVLWVASALTPTPLVTLATPLRFLEPFHLNDLSAPLDWLRRWNWSQERFDAFTLLALLWLVGWALGSRRMVRASPALTIVSALTMALGFYSAQFRDLAAWTAWLPLGVAFAPDHRGLWARVRSGFAVAAGLAGIVWLLPSARFPLGVRPLTSSLPVRAVALADSAHLTGLVLNTPENGGYILAIRGPEHPPLLDSRLRGGDRFLESFFEAGLSPLGLDRFLESWEFSHAIVPLPRNLDDRLATNFAQRLEWALVSYDDGGCLYVRWHDQPRLAQSAYRYLSPSAVSMTEMIVSSLADSGLSRRLEGELLRARASSPAHAHADVWLGELLLAHNRAPEALRYLEEGDRIAPSTPRLAFALGRSYDATGQPAKARAAYTRAIHQGDDADEARRKLRQEAAEEP